MAGNEIDLNGTVVSPLECHFYQADTGNAID